MDIAENEQNWQKCVKHKTSTGTSINLFLVETVKNTSRWSSALKCMNHPWFILHRSRAPHSNNVTNCFVAGGIRNWPITECLSNVARLNRRLDIFMSVLSNCLSNARTRRRHISHELDIRHFVTLFKTHKSLTTNRPLSLQSQNSRLIHI